jgi:hypothetical protein
MRSRMSADGDHDHIGFVTMIANGGMNAAIGKASSEDQIEDQIHECPGICRFDFTERVILRSHQ